VNDARARLAPGAAFGSVGGRVTRPKNVAVGERGTLEVFATTPILPWPMRLQHNARRGVCG
jgi:hypothetical protein